MTNLRQIAATVNEEAIAVEVIVVVAAVVVVD